MFSAVEVNIQSRYFVCVILSVIQIFGRRRERFTGVKRKTADDKTTNNTREWKSKTKYR
jgi:uncharacterized membrane protein